MTVRIVTDSTSDLPAELAEKLGITVVPIRVLFGPNAFLDGIDISSEELMEKLRNENIHPSTSQPNPDDFITTYSGLLAKNEGIVSIHISSLISGTLNSAATARQSMPQPERIAVIDSRLNSAGLALIALKAARMAEKGASLADITAETELAVQRTKMLGMFDTMKYLARGGRVNKAIANIGDFLSIKPLLTFRDGEIVRAGMVRTLSQGMNRLYEFVAKKPDLEDIMVAHSAIPEAAEQLREKLGNLFPKERITITRLGAALGTHGGPGVLLVAVRTGN